MKCGELGSAGTNGDAENCLDWGIRGVRAKRTHGQLGCGVDSNKEAQSLPMAPERTDSGPGVTGFTMIPTSAHTGGAGAADGAQVPPPGHGHFVPDRLLWSPGHHRCRNGQMPHQNK